MELELNVKCQVCGNKIPYRMDSMYDGEIAKVTIVCDPCPDCEQNTSKASDMEGNVLHAYLKAHAEGYEMGYNNAKKVLGQENYQDGYEEGYKHGHSDGFQKGHDECNDAGFHAGQQSVLDSINQMLKRAKPNHGKSGDDDDPLN